MVCREPALKTVQDCPFGELAQHGVISHTDGSCVGVLFSGVRMFVYANDIENTDAATITKLDTEMIHNEFGVKGQGHNSQWVLFFRQNTLLPLAVYVSHTGFSMVHCPAAQTEILHKLYFFN